MKKISLSVLVLWVAIGVSLSAIYIPVLSDSQELLINTLNSATGNILGNDLNFSLPLVSLIQGELNKDYFEIYPSTNSGASATPSQNNVNIPTMNLPATVIPTTPSPTTPPTGTNTDNTDTSTDKDSSTSETKKNSSIKEPKPHIPEYILDYHHKYHRHYHQLHHPKKNSRDTKN